jgi:hypothetical protein
MNHKENKENLKEEKVCDLKAGYVQHTSPHQNPPSLNGTIPQFIMYCQKQAMVEATIRTKYKILRVMLRNSVNLSNPEEVKLFLRFFENY